MEDRKSPFIAVSFINNIEGNIVEDILAGIEEEGVPSKTFKYSEGTAEELAVEGINYSSLGISLGIDNKEAVVYIRHMEKNKMLFRVPFLSHELRKLGSNAARYVKGISFKI